MTTLNLTQHNASKEQLNCGVIELNDSHKTRVKELLTFDNIPSKEEINERAIQITDIAYMYGVSSAMIGGAPFLMSALEQTLVLRNIAPLYAFSVRESVETTAPDGSVVKSSVFKHRGFVEV